MPTPYNLLFSQPRPDKSTMQTRKAWGALDMERTPSGSVFQCHGQPTHYVVGWRPSESRASQALLVRTFKSRKRLMASLSTMSGERSGHSLCFQSNRVRALRVCHYTLCAGHQNTGGPTSKTGTAAAQRPTDCPGEPQRSFGRADSKTCGFQRRPRRDTEVPLGLAGAKRVLGGRIDLPTRLRI